MKPTEFTCADCDGTGQADWSSSEYVIPCGSCNGTGTQTNHPEGESCRLVD